MDAFLAQISTWLKWCLSHLSPDDACHPAYFAGEVQRPLVQGDALNFADEGKAWRGVIECDGASLPLGPPPVAALSLTVLAVLQIPRVLHADAAGSGARRHHALFV